MHVDPFDQASSVPVALVAVILPNFNHTLAAKTANFTAPWEEGRRTKYAGKPAFIVGGSSSVGQYGTFLHVAKYSGYSPINTTASLHNEALKPLGATAVLDRKLLASSEARTPQTLAYHALAQGGTLFIVLNDEIPEEKKIQKAPNKVEVLPDGLAGIPDGLERLKQDKVRGSSLTVAHPQETA
ncbi:hypothetical protein OH76DRAFT_1479124 [Lentinus brumalis]|uniref:Uncharacterized protein n=1 Tax=Lentinus brumalis TaxID=2498619 RepID=A0A371DNE9_9APHY|nr:hypothetical protein OH76DRAFT_1479124 [Polyporus brumalis]